MPHQDNRAARRAAINSANAQRSTDPKSEPGKQRARFNACRHGLTGQTVVMPWEDRDQYTVFCQKLATDFKPQGAYEEQLVQTIADATWRLNRAAAAENNLFAGELHEREDFIATGDHQVDAAFTVGHVFRTESQMLANMAMYVQRIGRQRDKAFEQLRALQSERRERERLAMAEAALLRKMHSIKDIPYNPAEDGFVFSVAEIDTFISREARKEESLRMVARAAA